MSKVSKNSLSSNEGHITKKTPTKSFIDNIDKMRNSHIRNCTGLYMGYEYEDYSKNQEQKDLEYYKRFINSSAYDDIREVEVEMGKTLTLSKLGKISSMRDDYH